MSWVIVYDTFMYESDNCTFIPCWDLADAKKFASYDEAESVGIASCSRHNILTYEVALASSLMRERNYKNLNLVSVEDIIRKFRHYEKDHPFDNVKLSVNDINDLLRVWYSSSERTS